MSKILTAATTAVLCFAVAPALAADMPYYPRIEIPEIEYGPGGSFYPRGSAAVNLHWAPVVRHGPSWAGEVAHPMDRHGYGYSWGAGFGYETGDGFRFDATIDSLETRGAGITKELANGIDEDGDYTLLLRTTLAMANAY